VREKTTTKIKFATTELTIRIEEQVSGSKNKYPEATSANTWQRKEPVFTSVVKR
jgi:hypothetical protein